MILARIDDGFRARACGTAGPSTAAIVKGSRNPSRGPAILVDQPAEHVPPFDRRMGRPPDLRCSITGGHSQVQSPMWSLVDVVRDARPKHSLEVLTPIDKEMVEALLAHSPHEPLRERIRPRCTDRRSDHADALGPKHRIEGSRVLGVPVAHEEPDMR